MLPSWSPAPHCLPGRSTASELPPGERCRGPEHGLCLLPTERYGHCVSNWEFFLNKIFEILLQPFPFFLHPPCLASALFHSTSHVQRRSSQHWKGKICSCVCDCPFQSHHVRQHRPLPQGNGWASEILYGGARPQGYSPECQGGCRAGWQLLSRETSDETPDAPVPHESCHSASQRGISARGQVLRYLGQIPPGASGLGAWPLLPLSPPSPGPWSFYLCCFFLKTSSRCGKACFLSL